MFYPGETVVHQFSIPFVRTDIVRVYVTYHQDDRIVIEKTVTQNDIEGEGAESTFSVSFTQADSLLFADDKCIEMQVNVVLTDGARCTSSVIKLSNSKQYHREVVNING